MERHPVATDDRSLVSGRLCATLVLVVVGAAAVAIALSIRAAQMQDAAEEQVFAWCGRLDADKASDKRWRRWPGPTLPELDPWGRPLHVRYEEKRFSEQLTVSSDGPDRRQWTRDDVVWTVSNTEWFALMQHSAEVVEGVAGAASRGIVGGAIEGVTDHLPKGMRDSLGIPSGKDPSPPPPAEKPQQK